MYALLYILSNRLSSATVQTPNPRFEGIAGKRSLPVPRPLRGRAAPQAKH